MKTLLAENTGRRGEPRAEAGVCGPRVACFLLAHGCSLSLRELTPLPSARSLHHGMTGPAAARAAPVSENSARRQAPDTAREPSPAPGALAVPAFLQEPRPKQTDSQGSSVFLIAG